MRIAALMLVVAVALAAACYPHNGPPTPSCAQEPSQPWCASVPFSASGPDAGARDR